MLGCVECPCNETTWIDCQHQTVRLCRQPEVLESASLVPPRSIREVEERLEADFTKSQYFVTGYRL